VGHPHRVGPTGAHVIEQAVCPVSRLPDRRKIDQQALFGRAAVPNEA
jgi:hypothetical protein